MRAAACTIIAKNYLPYARVLMSSVERWHPEWLRFVVLVDTVDGYFEPKKENFELILSSDLGLPDTRWFHFKYNILELSTAVKPFAVGKLFREYGLDAVVYLDPDIQIFNRLEPVSRALANSDIILTPHLTSAITDKKRPGELDILYTGVYNLGFIGLSNRASAERFLNWWCSRLEHQCLIEPERGLFVDQRWCDLAPGLFENVQILRDPGLNVAYWNIQSRQVSRNGSTYVVNDEPLYFFHFSGFDPENPDQFSRYQDRFRLSETGRACELAWTYRKALFRSGYQKCKDWRYQFGFVADGTPIPDVMRPILREAAGLTEVIHDPFSTSGFQQICKAWNEAVPDPAGPPYFTRLARRIYAIGADLRAAYPDIFGQDRDRYLGWLAHRAAQAYGTPEEVNAAFREGLRTFNEGNRGLASGESFDGNDTGVCGGNRANSRLHTFMGYIHESRPDLREAFPDPAGPDRLDYLTWLYTYGRVEYEMDSASATLIRREWENAARVRGSLIRALWQRIRRAAYGVSARMSARYMRGAAPLAWPVGRWRNRTGGD